MSNKTEHQTAPEHVRTREFWSLLAYAAGLGVLGALVALVFLGITDFGGSWYGDPDLGWFGGEWWWIAVAAGAGVVVGILRRVMHMPEKSPGLVADLKSEHIDPSEVPAVAVISAVSLMGGASIGPENALGTMNGGAASWISQRQKLDDETSRVNTLSGLAGAYGGLFSSPIVTVMLILEIARPRGRHYTRAFVGTVLAASVSFGVYFAIAGSVFFGIFDVPEYDYADWHLLAGIAFGLLAVVLVLLLMGIMSLVTRAFSLLKNHHILRSTIGGALFGLIGVALPLTMFTGSDQLHTALQNAATLGVGLLIAVLLGKMLAFSVSLASGFVGGVIFPLLFIGGISGMIINQLFADVPLGLAFACLLAAVPGSLIAAPFTMVLLTALVTQMGALQTAPVLIAATTAYLTMWRVRTLLEKRKQPSTTDVNRQ